MKKYWDLSNYFICVHLCLAAITCKGRRLVGTNFNEAESITDNSVEEVFQKNE